MFQYFLSSDGRRTILVDHSSHTKHVIKRSTITQWTTFSFDNNQNNYVIAIWIITIEFPPFTCLLFDCIFNGKTHKPMPFTIWWNTATPSLHSFVESKYLITTITYIAINEGVKGFTNSKCITQILFSWKYLQIENSNISNMKRYILLSLWFVCVCVCNKIFD